MNRPVTLVFAAALVAIAGCSSGPGDAASAKAAKVRQVQAPRSGDWTKVISATAAGGFVMGNPEARVKLVEYGSLTCPHCRAFDENGVPALVNSYVKSGEISWELRNYVRDAFDMTASLIARCNGKENFFQLSRALYKAQPEWVAKAQAVPHGKLESLLNLGPNRRFVELAKVSGLQSWAAAHGVAAGKSAQCLSNERSVDQLIEETGKATKQYPDFAGTPTFIVNGSILSDTATWDKLEPQLKAALGKRG